MHGSEGGAGQINAPFLPLSLARHVANRLDSRTVWHARGSCGYNLPSSRSSLRCAGGAQKIPLPADSGFLCCKTFPRRHYLPHLFVSRKRKKPMDMIRHHQEQVHEPAVHSAVMVRCANENAGCVIREDMVAALRGAYRDEKYGTIRDPRGNFVRECLSFGKQHPRTGSNQKHCIQRNQRTGRAGRPGPPWVSSARRSLAPDAERSARRSDPTSF